MVDRAPVRTSDLREIPAFHSLPDAQVSSVAALMVRRHFAPGQIIFMEGDKSGAMWFVFSGRVKIIKQSLNGRIQGLCLMDRGKCFGGCSLFDMDHNPATAQALTEVTLFILPEQAVGQMGENDPNLVKVLLHIYSQRLEHLARVSEVLGSWTVADRINDCLLTYINRSVQPPVVDLTHEKLASLSGTVREVVTRHLSLLEKEGVVHNTSGHIIILNPDALLPPCAAESR
jgi:CRP/FNR family transcriptional regulator